MVCWLSALGVVVCLAILSASQQLSPVLGAWVLGYQSAEPKTSLEPTPEHAGKATPGASSTDNSSMLSRPLSS